MTAAIVGMSNRENWYAGIQRLHCGSGAAGGVMAKELCEEGAKVISLKAGVEALPGEFLSHKWPYQLPYRGLRGTPGISPGLRGLDHGVSMELSSPLPMVRRSHANRCLTVFCTLRNVRALKAGEVAVYVLDSALAKELNTGWRVRGAAPVKDAAQAARAGGPGHLPGRKATVEPVTGILREQRGMRRLRLRGLAKVGIELALTCAAYDLTWM